MRLLVHVSLVDGMEKVHTFEKALLVDLLPMPMVVGFVDGSRTRTHGGKVQLLAIGIQSEI